MPDFDTSEFTVDYVKITPFHEAGDRPQNETYPDDGWGTPEMLIPSAPEALPGDVTGDGVTDAADAAALQRWLLGTGELLREPQAGDLNEDGVLDVFDLSLLKRLLLRREEA